MSFSLNNFNNFIDSNGENIKKSFIKEQKKIIFENIENHSSKKKKLIFFLYSNNIEFYLYYLKIFYSKDVMLLLNENINFKYLQQLITKYKPDFIVHPYRKEQRNFTNYTLCFYTKYYTFLKINKSYDHNLFKDLSTLLTTSASTGSKKFVRISYENIYENSKSIIKYLKIKSSDKLITTLPVDYTYGFSQLNTHLIQNASIIINRYSLLQKEFWNLLQKSKATTFGGVPFSFEVLKKLKSEKLNFYNVKNITQAGGKLNEDLQIYFSNVFKKKKIKFFIMYGSTEATSRMTYLPPKYISKKIGSVGISIPKTKIEIDKSNVNKNEHGEVIFFGKNVSLGYLENLEDLSLDNQNKGVLRTGDIGYKDEDNFLYITGRLKRFIKLFGHRINLDELQNEIQKKIKKSDIICTGSDTSINIHLTNKKFTKKIQIFLKKKLNISLNNLNFKYIKKIPLTNSNKVDYKKLI